jgi:hypothetical protein
MGGGKVQRAAEHATVDMDLAGALSCAAIARSAAAAHVGTFLSTVIGKAAKQLVEGSVAVRVRIAADTRNLDAARVLPTIGVGCGLVPLKALDPRLRKLLPPELLALADALPEALPGPGTPWPKPPAQPLPTLADLQKRVLETPLPALPSAFPLPLRLPKPAGSSPPARE